MPRSAVVRADHLVVPGLQDVAEARPDELAAGTDVDGDVGADHREVVEVSTLVDHLEGTILGDVDALGVVDVVEVVVDGGPRRTGR
jgi:hypothetical protein